MTLRKANIDVETAKKMSPRECESTNPNDVLSEEAKVIVIDKAFKYLVDTKMLVIVGRDEQGRTLYSLTKSRSKLSRALDWASRLRVV